MRELENAEMIKKYVYLTKRIEKWNNNKNITIIPL